MIHIILWVVESGSPGTPMSSSTSGWSSSQASVSGYAYSKVSR